MISKWMVGGCSVEGIVFIWAINYILSLTTTVFVDTHIYPHFDQKNLMLNYIANP